MSKIDSILYVFALLLNPLFLFSLRPLPYFSISSPPLFVLPSQVIQFHLFPNHSSTLSAAGYCRYRNSGPLSEEPSVIEDSLRYSLGEVRI